MLTRLTAVEFVRGAENGRTRPIMLVCRDQHGPDIELYAKVSARCEQGVVHLAREAIAACLAGDLCLPVPQPFLVDLPAAWIATIPDAEARRAVEASAPVAFGSRLVGAQFATWHSGVLLRSTMADTALGIFVFDAIIQNFDRRDGNANCLVLGDNLRIIDHELAFAHRTMLLWHPPWEHGALQALVPPGKHIFRDKLRKFELNFDAIRACWTGLSNARIDGYAAGLPVEWAPATPDVAAAIDLIKAARDRIDDCLKEIQRVLT